MMNLWMLAFALGLAFIAFTAAVLVIGLIVTKRHPAPYDPARNAKRYVAPAGICFGLAVGCFLGSAASAIGAIVTS